MKRTGQRRRRSVRVIGIGRADRGDDAVGLVVAQALRAARMPGVRVMATTGDGTALMEAWRNADTVFVVDAIRSGARPGVIHRIAAHRGPLPAAFRHSSTHSFGLAEAIEWSRLAGQLPRRLILYGIEGSTFTLGSHLSPEVAEAAAKLVRRLRRRLQSG